MKRSWQVGLWLVCASGGLGVGCAGSDMTATPTASYTNGPLQLERYAQEFAKAFCSGVGPCCKGAAIAFSGPDCSRAATEYYTREVTDNTSPNMKYDASLAGQCLDFMKRGLTSCSFPPPSLVDFVCVGVFSGPTANGDACTRNVDCQSSYCAFGHCATRGDHPIAKMGEACTGDCRPNTSGNEVCQDTPFAAHPRVPAYCDATSGLFCDDSATLSDPTAVPTCAGVLGNGVRCYGRGCLPDTYCNPDTEPATCADQEESGPCTSAEACSFYSYCDGVVGAPPGTHNTGRCLPKKPDGAACVSPLECQTGACGGGTEAERTCGPDMVATPSRCAGHP